MTTLASQIREISTKHLEFIKEQQYTELLYNINVSAREGKYSLKTECDSRFIDVFLQRLIDPECGFKVYKYQDSLYIRW